MFIIASGLIALTGSISDVVLPSRGAVPNGSPVKNLGLPTGKVKVCSFNPQMHKQQQPL